ncbi:MAG: D-arabinono-1,4-lactone oxidase [Pseudomonadota bacterium]
MNPISRRNFLANSALAALYGMVNPIMAQASTSQTTPWRNWSGGLVSHPAARFSPATEQQLSEFLATTQGQLRPVGAGHSFSSLVPTDGHLLILDQLTGLLSHDTSANIATFAAGTRLGDMGVPLAEIGQAAINLPDIDRQTLAGATATATHGTGIKFQCLSGYITQLKLITPDGEAHELNRTSSTDLFDAARVGLGALGVVSQVSMQNQAKYRLKQMSWIGKTADLLKEFDQQVVAHRHFELFPLVHSDYSIALATDETNEPINNLPASPEEEAGFAMAMQAWMQIPPGQRRPLINGLAEQIEPSERVDESYKILTNIRNNRFNEMEYSVPVHSGADCLQEVLQTVADREIDVVFPLEYRYVARDDTMLSMSSGDEDHAAISIHQVASEDYRPYFDVIEPIFWKYGGRPHWGKIHSLGAEQLTKLYPRFEEFRAIRNKLDPTGRMLNAHLQKLFDVKG